MKELEMVVDKTIYDWFSEHQPTAINVVRLLLREGATPGTIEQRVRRKASAQTARNFFHLAEYLLANNQISSSERKEGG